MADPRLLKNKERVVAPSSTSSAPYEFDRDTSLTTVDDGRYRGDISEGWTVIDGAPNGGYVMALATRALCATLDLPDVLSVTGHYVRPCDTGPVDVHVDEVRSGSRHATGMVRLVQEGIERLRVLGTLGDLDRADGATLVTGTPPDLPAVEDCASAPSDIDLPPVIRRFDLRLTPASSGWAVGEPSGEATMAGWMRFADGRPPDMLSLGMFADVLPPTPLNVVDQVSWVPTLELTVHGRARPADGWLRAVVRTRFLVDGYLEEDGEIWDSEDRLVAQSRQLAMIL